MSEVPVRTKKVRTAYRPTSSTDYITLTLSLSRFSSPGAPAEGFGLLDTVIIYK